MKIKFSVIKSLILISFLAVLIYFYSDVFYFIAIALVISIITRPLKQGLLKIRIGRFKFNNTLASVISLLAIVLAITAFFVYVGPLIIKEASQISNIDLSVLEDYFQGRINQLTHLLREYDIIQSEQDLSLLIEEQLKSVIDLASFSFVFGRLISTASSIFMAIFMIFFLSFFFIKEPEIIKQFARVLTPAGYEQKVEQILSDSRKMLSRYFIGLLIEITAMVLLISLGLQIMGVHNALLIGFLGGLMNVIPYLGPLIGAAIGLLLGLIYILSMYMFDQIVYTTFAILGSFVVANLIDNLLLQPLIYSKSVKAHPVEIFLVIIIAGKFAGIIGMIAAIPVYTVLKIMYRQFSASGEKVFSDNMIKELEEENDELHINKDQ